MAKLLYIFIGTLFLSGCAHHQLRFQTVQQANTLSQVYEQQVLDNLAMFAVKPNAIPFFAYTSEGGTSVDSHAGAAAAAPLDPFFSILDLEGARDSSEAWVLTPVADPTRLNLMQQAYQRALGLPGDPCHDWCLELNKFRGENPPHCPEDCPITCGWLCQSDRKRDIPKCRCKSYGSYCGTYVWVKPGCDAEFSRLAFLILELAINEQKEVVKPTKTVTFFIDEQGRATKEADAYGTIETIMGIDDNVQTALLPASGPGLRELGARLDQEREAFDQLLTPGAMALLDQFGATDPSKLPKAIVESSPDLSTDDKSQLQRLIDSKAKIEALEKQFNERMLQHESNLEVPTFVVPKPDPLRPRRDIQSQQLRLNLLGRPN
jgi:hypothetical protein